jgi:DNA modification methylase
MVSKHQIFFQDASKMRIQDRTVDLVVTSPPYPMIEMWDSLFSSKSEQIGNYLAQNKGREAHPLMLAYLFEIFDRVIASLKYGGIACIVIGDATRSMNNDFQVYTNHASILRYFVSRGFEALPEILWCKPSNKPNKFMGSGMLPPNAYVTQEHEYILILRKGGKRVFTHDQKHLRSESAYFWEERNKWFSDVWFDLRGSKQDLTELKRSAAFPFDLAYRLINMFSIKGDLVLDPFLGTGTSTFAAMASNRNSIGYEIDPKFRSFIQTRIEDAPAFITHYLADRLLRHREFLQKQTDAGKLLKYTMKYSGNQARVMTAQEVNLKLDFLRDIKNMKTTASLEYWASYFSEPIEFTELNLSNKEKKRLQELGEKERTQIICDHIWEPDPDYDAMCDWEHSRGKVCSKCGKKITEKEWLDRKKKERESE